MTHSRGDNPPLTPAASPAERMPFHPLSSNAFLSARTPVKGELVMPRVCLSNMLQDWLSPRMAVTERFVRVGIRAGDRC